MSKYPAYIDIGSLIGQKVERMWLNERSQVVLEFENKLMLVVKEFDESQVGGKPRPESTLAWQWSIGGLVERS